MLAKIVKTGTTDEASAGEEGELCIHGPAVMLGYLDQPEESAQTLKKHAGRPDLAPYGRYRRDGSGRPFTFKLRLKRMIKFLGDECLSRPG